MTLSHSHNVWPVIINTQSKRNSIAVVLSGGQQSYSRYKFPCCFLVACMSHHQVGLRACRIITIPLSAASGKSKTCHSNETNIYSPNTVMLSHGYDENKTKIKQFYNLF